MAKLLKMSDRIKLTVGEIVFTIAPLSYQQKQELADCLRIDGGDEIKAVLASQALYIKYALKDVSGIEDYDGNEYKLRFDGDVLTDDCVSEIMSLEEKANLTSAGWQIINGIRDLKDPVTGKEMKGVKLEYVSGK